MKSKIRNIVTKHPQKLFSQLQNKENDTIVRWLFRSAILPYLLITGCNTETATNNPAFSDNPKIIRNDAPADELAIVSAEPALAATLSVGQKLTFDIVYDLKSVNRAAIWVRPFVNGQRAPAYRAHHLVLVTKDTENPGVVTGWFYFDKPMQINEVRLYMQNLDTGATVKELSYPISAAWTNQ
jgi:hypothetical protein